MIKYGVFITSVNVFDDFFSFDFAKKEDTTNNTIDYFDNCIVYNVNNFACDCMYNLNSMKYKEIYNLQNKLYYMIQDYKKGNTKKLVDYCNKKDSYLRVNNKIVNL